MLRRLAKGMGANAFGQLVNTGLQLAVVPVLASHWGLERYGVWLMISTVPFYLQVSDFGFAKACGTDMTIKAARGDIDGALAAFQTGWAFSLVVTAVLATIIALACALLPGDLFGTANVPASEVRLALALMGIYGLIVLNGNLLSGGFQSSGNYPLESTVISLMWLAEGIAALIVAMLGGGIVEVAAAYFLCRIVGFAIATLIMHRVAPGIHLGLRHANRADARRLLPPALGMMGVPMAQAFILQGTALAIGWAASAAAVPAYTTTRTLTRFGIQLVGIVTRASMPEFSMASAREDSRLQIRLILLVLLTSFVILVPIALVLLVAGPQIIALWTHDVVHVTPLLVALMSAVMLANGAWAPVSGMIVAVNRQGLFTPQFAALAVLSMPVTYFLALRLGAVAGAIASLAVDLAMCVLVARIITRLFARPGELLQALPQLWRDGRTLYGRLRSR